MNVAPAITLHPANQVYRLGDLANISCAASGQPTPTYQWIFNDVPLPGEVSPNLIIPSVGTEHRGLYYCIATNEAGTDQSTKAELTLEGIWDRFNFKSFSVFV